MFGFGKGKKQDNCRDNCGLTIEDVRDAVNDMGLKTITPEKGDYEIEVSDCTIETLLLADEASYFPTRYKKMGIFTQKYDDWHTGHPELFETNETEKVLNRLHIRPVNDWSGRGYEGRRFLKWVDLSGEYPLAKKRLKQAIDKMLVFTEYLGESLETILGPTQDIQENIVKKSDSDAMKKMRAYIA